MHHLPSVLFYKSYPTAKLAAEVKNAMGGKADPTDKDAKLVPPERLYTPEELLPYFARPDWLPIIEVVSAAAAKDFRKHMKLVPDWVLQIAPMQAIKAAAS